jgi:hypothetical protein
MEAGGSGNLESEKPVNAPNEQRRRGDADMSNDAAEPSAPLGGSATQAGLTLTDVGILYEEWKRLHCGPREMVTLCRKPKWKAVFSVPWLWWSHFGVACQYTTTVQAARLATLFVWAFLTVRK